MSPYHLSTRELTATVALTLADHAVTLVPEPAEGHAREDVRSAIGRVPRLLRVLESWRWSGPLWRAGLIAGEDGGERPNAGMSDVGALAASDPSLARLGSAFSRPAEPGDEADRRLDALCSDLLRGGPDPAMSTIVTGALDRFAAMHDCAVVRGSTDSLAQRAEIRLMRRSFSIAIPVMSRAAGGRLLLLRAALRKELATLRSAMLDVWNSTQSRDDEPVSRLNLAAAAYAEAFEDWFAAASRDDENAERTMRAFVSLTGAVLPADSAIVCARAAIRNVARASGRPAATAAAVAAQALDAPALRAILIRPMNVRPV